LNLINSEQGFILLQHFLNLINLETGDYIQKKDKKNKKKFSE